MRKLRTRVEIIANTVLPGLFPDDMDKLVRQSKQKPGRQDYLVVTQHRHETGNIRYHCNLVIPRLGNTKGLTGHSGLGIIYWGAYFELDLEPGHNAKDEVVLGNEIARWFKARGKFAQKVYQAVRKLYVEDIGSDIKPKTKPRKVHVVITH